MGTLTLFSVSVCIVGVRAAGGEHNRIQQTPVDSHLSSLLLLARLYDDGMLLYSLLTTHANVRLDARYVYSSLLE